MFFSNLNVLAGHLPFYTYQIVQNRFKSRLYLQNEFNNVKIKQKLYLAKTFLVPRTFLKCLHWLGGKLSFLHSELFPTNLSAMFWEDGNIMNIIFYIHFWKHNQNVLRGNFVSWLCRKSAYSVLKSIQCLCWGRFFISLFVCGNIIEQQCLVPKNILVIFFRKYFCMKNISII